MVREVSNLKPSNLEIGLIFGLIGIFLGAILMAFIHFPPCWIFGQCEQPIICIDQSKQMEKEICDYNVVNKDKDFLYLNAKPFVWENKEWVYVNEWDSIEFCPYWECESKIIKEYTNKEGKHCVEFQGSFDEFPESCLRWD